jgi:hypothetical protein
MTTKATVVTPTERVENLKSMLFDALKQANTTAVSLASLEDAQLEPAIEPIMELFASLGEAISEVLHLQDDLELLRVSSNPIQRAVTLAT